ncbi:MAG: protein kinase, partial [Deltaproteobacteria bacterium]|nr:protein kinase [Deltaproteobacteria bacterium]
MTQNVPETASFGHRYSVIRKLGSGAQGAVYLVEDRHLASHRVALKVLRPEAEPSWRDTFRHEFEVLAGLHHPRLARVHDFGTAPDGRLFFTRDFVDGVDLRRRSEGMGAVDAVAMAIEICRALKPLHRRGLIHGDLKPGNIIGSASGVVQIIGGSFPDAPGDPSTAVLR